MADVALQARLAPINALALPFPLNREAIADQIETLIAVLDALDGDADFEPDGDELDGNASEDDFVAWPPEWGAAGCPIADPGGGNVEDELQADAADGTELLKTLPRYGADQTKGPINETIALQRRDLRIRICGDPQYDNDVREKLKQLDRREAALPYC